MIAHSTDTISEAGPGYGKVNHDGTPADPASYDYTRSARDAIHFAALFDRFILDLRRPARRITGELSRVEGGARVDDVPVHKAPWMRCT
ncbi:MAG TPA: replication initiator [Streptosporangiaceae bacterium]|nr:replication initiator [Streptosporangiaceae bacterium]